MKPELSKYTPLPERIILDEPIVEKETKGVLKPETVIKKEKSDWVLEGKPLKVSKDFESKSGVNIKAGEYVVLTSNAGMTHIQFADESRWQIPITSVAGHFTI